MDTAKSYDALAKHYHLLFENWDASIERQAGALASILQRECGLMTAQRILDCACGIGTQALGLAKMGFQVSGCDLSPAAVERARVEASQRSLNIQFSIASMLNLTSLGDGFDAVICMDNALPHLESTQELIQAAEQARARLRREGCFIASIRDYDQLLQERPLVQGPAFYSDQGHRRIVFQVWEWVDDSRYDFHLYITRELASEWQTFHTCARYRALRRDELTAALGEAGFRNARWIFPTQTGFYQPIVVAKAN